LNFGEKLQLLRKQGGMSQEQLAEKLNVSRQAISKWELGGSLPDIENVIQLSRLFGVSTDYLLLDEIKTETSPPGVKIKENDLKAEMHIKNSFIIGIGIIAIGLLISLIGWKTYQTEMAVGIGIIVQICGIILFEIMSNRLGNSNKLAVKCGFYSVAIWMICPFIAPFISRIALGIYPKPYTYWTALNIPAVIYFVICTAVTIVLRIIKNTNEKKVVSKER